LERTTETARRGDDEGRGASAKREPNDLAARPVTELRVFGSVTCQI
jgi:hypothetical protein